MRWTIRFTCTPSITLCDSFSFSEQTPCSWGQRTCHREPEGGMCTFWTHKFPGKWRNRHRNRIIRLYMSVATFRWTRNHLGLIVSSLKKTHTHSFLAGPLQEKPNSTNGTSCASFFLWLIYHLLFFFFTRTSNSVIIPTQWCFPDSLVSTFANSVRTSDKYIYSSWKFNSPCLLSRF